MTIEFFTGFEGCGSTADIQAFFDMTYSSSYPAYNNSGNGFDGGKCIRSGIVLGYCRKSCTAAKTKVVGFHVNDCAKYSYSSDTYNALIRFIGPQVTIFNSSSGLDIRVSATQIDTSAAQIGSGLTHVEIKVFSDASAGTVEVKLNGVSVYEGTGLNTGGADISSIYWGTCGNTTHYLDNLFIADDWQGELRSYVLRPTSDVAAGFTPLSGTDNYAMVDDTGDDGDTTYVASDTVSTKDLYGYGNIDTHTIVKAVSLVTVARKDDAGARSIQHASRQDSTDYDHTAFALPTAYPGATGEGQFEVLNAAPDSSAWTPAVLNDIAWGFKVSA